MRKTGFVLRPQGGDNAHPLGARHNALSDHGSWAFAEFIDVWTIATELAAKDEAWLDGVGNEQSKEHRCSHDRLV